MEWWIWLLAGLLLLLGELITPGGFYILFFGIGAILVGILAGLSVGGPLWFQFILFPVFSVLTLWLFRDRLVQLTSVRQTGEMDSLVGETAVMLEEIAVNAVGKAEMRGSSWSARNIGEKALARGERGKVQRVEGLTLLVRAE